MSRRLALNISPRFPSHRPVALARYAVSHLQCLSYLLTLTFIAGIQTDPILTLANYLVQCHYFDHVRMLLRAAALIVRTWEEAGNPSRHRNHCSAMAASATRIMMNNLTHRLLDLNHDWRAAGWRPRATPMLFEVVKRCGLGDQEQNHLLYHCSA